MDTQNVSAQLYFKQLPVDNSAASYNCQDTFPNLSTCVNNVETDAQIENAYQEQLNLSEIYKSPVIFNEVKKKYMDETMEAENKPVSSEKAQPLPPSVAVKIPVGPEDFLRRFVKESFGSTSNTIIIVVVVVVLVVLLFMLFSGNGFSLFDGFVLFDMFR
jgi:hypothetical protein